MKRKLMKMQSGINHIDRLALTRELICLLNDGQDESQILEKVKSILDQGININKKIDHYTYFPLLNAVNRGFLNIVKLFVAEGADVNCYCHGLSPLFLAISNKDREIAEFLIENGADISGAYRVCTTNHDMVKFLVEVCGYAPDLKTIDETENREIKSFLTLDRYVGANQTVTPFFNLSSSNISSKYFQNTGISSGIFK